MRLNGIRALSFVVGIWLLQGCSALFPTKAGASLAHFGDAAPDVGEAAPMFVVRDLDGQTVSLAEQIGRMPIVVQLGSYSCPVFRYRRFDMRPLREKYAGRVKFFVIYTQEAHPQGVASPYSQDEWVPLINRLARVTPAQTRDWSDRSALALLARERMQSNAEFLVDDPANGVWSAYGRAPSAAFVIDLDGRVYLRQPWVEPVALEAAIEALLLQAPH